MSLSSSSESSSSAAPTKKRSILESSDSSDDCDTADASGDDEDAPKHMVLPEDNTVLSHAERRRQKRKQQQRMVTSSGSPHKKRKLNVHVKIETKTTARTTVVDDPRRPKRQNSVWVGNLAFRTTQDALRGFFDGVGKITRIHMPMRLAKQTQSENMGFAYVDFETPDAKVIAITLSESLLDGRKLLIKDGNDFTGRPAKAKAGASETDNGEKQAKTATTADGKGLSKTAQKILRAQKQQPAPTLFLGNLGFETTEESIRELFKAHRCRGRKDVETEKLDEDEGKDGTAKSKDVWIRKVRMGTFEDSGACKGFAFVDFTSIEHATAALVNPRNHHLNGRELVVEYASAEAVRRGGGPRHAKGVHDRKGKDGHTKIQPKDYTNVLYTKKNQPRAIEVERGADGATEATTAIRSKHSDRPDHDRPHATRRPKPGAALAHAQRQSAAIIPSQGKKILF